MKKICLPILSVTLIISALLISTEKEVQAQTATRFSPCVCYTYFSDGHIEVGQSCDQPNVNGACAKLVMCLPKNKEDR